MEKELKNQQNNSWEEEYVELYGYLDKYVKGIVGRQGKWIANLLEQERIKWEREQSFKFALGVKTQEQIRTEEHTRVLKEVDTLLKDVG